jgi:hypothetical protein
MVTGSAFALLRFRFGSRFVAQQRGRENKVLVMGLLYFHPSPGSILKDRGCGSGGAIMQHSGILSLTLHLPTISLIVVPVDYHIRSLNDKRPGHPLDLQQDRRNPHRHAALKSWRDRTLALRPITTPTYSTEENSVRFSS